MYAGKQITNMKDPLVKINVEYLYHSIRNPKPEVEAKIRHLRIVKDMDKQAYAKCKRELPYLVCGVFNPPFRCTENFAYTEYFIMDIDHISAKELALPSVRREIENDERVVLSFLSPGEDGLKVLFRLKERCTEPSIYKLFYRIFARKFSEQYHLEQVLDMQTNDVCRACFISYDADVYYNPNATAVDLSAFVNADDSMDFFDKKHELEQEQKLAAKEKREEANVVVKDPDSESIARIKEILRLQNKKPEKPPVIVSEHLTEIMDELRDYIEQTGACVSEVININYGKKIRIQLGMRLAEVNVFYGKRGYSVVMSPRSGTNAELNELMTDVIRGFFVQ